MKVLAAEADARWAAKESFLDAPGQPEGQTLPALNTEKDRSLRLETEADGTKRPAIESSDRRTVDEGGTAASSNAIESSADQARPDEERDPWKKVRGGPSEDWQPQPWTPPASKRR